MKGLPGLPGQVKFFILRALGLRIHEGFVPSGFMNALSVDSSVPDVSTLTFRESWSLFGDMIFAFPRCCKKPESLTNQDAERV